MTISSAICVFVAYFYFKVENDAHAECFYFQLMTGFTFVSLKEKKNTLKIIVIYVIICTQVNWTTRLLEIAFFHYIYG